MHTAVLSSCYFFFLPLCSTFISLLCMVIILPPFMQTLSLSLLHSSLYVPHLVNQNLQSSLPPENPIDTSCGYMFLLSVLLIQLLERGDRTFMSTWLSTPLSTVPLADILKSSLEFPNILISHTVNLTIGFVNCLKFIFIYIFRGFILQIQFM